MEIIIETNQYSEFNEVSITCDSDTCGCHALGCIDCSPDSCNCDALGCMAF